MKRRRIILFTLLSLLIVLKLHSFLSVSALTNNNQSENNINTFLSNTYIVGDLVDFPNLVINDDVYDRVVYSPSGQGYISDRLNLDESGQWKIVYSHQNDYKEYCFIVNKPMFSVEGINSIVKYGKAIDFTNYTAENKGGVYQRIYANESIAYNKPIDLNSKTKDDVLVKFTVLPEVVGTPDAKRFIITLTDCFNKNNYVMIMVKYVGGDIWGQRTVYIMAGSTGQEGVGLEHAEGGFIYEGENVRLHKGFYDWPFGTNVVFALNGRTNYSIEPTPDSVGLEDLTISMDYSEKRIYANNQLICDLDDPIIQDVIWDGFKDNKCYLSFSADLYNTVAFNLLIEQIDNDSELKDEYMVNTVKPTIYLDNPNPDYINNLFVGKQFKVPEAKAFDAYGEEVKVTSNVYTSYKTGNEANVLVIDGCIIPNQERDYYFVYEALDSYGNVSTRVLVLNAVSIDSTTELSIGYKEPDTQYVVGDKANIPIPLIKNYNGNYKVCVEALYDGKKDTIIEYTNDNEPESIDYNLLKSGTITIKYVYSDIYFTKEESYSINVEKGGTPVFISDPVLPKYIIKDALYDTPNATGYSFKSGEAELINADIYIGTNQDFSNATKVNESKYKCTESTDKLYYFFKVDDLVKVYEVPVYDINYGTNELNITNYFTGFSNASLSKNIGCIYQIKNTNNEYKLSYLKELQSYEFAFGFSLVNKDGFSDISIYLIDSKDFNNILKLSFISQNDKIYASLNDGTALQIADSLEESILFRYHSTSNTITFSSDKVMNVTNNYNGDKWKGFNEETIWLEIVVNNPSTLNPSISIERINNQLFYDYKKFTSIDESPEIFQKDISGDKNINSQVTIPKIYYGDTFAFNIKVKMTIEDPDGNFVESINGILLDGNENPNDIYTISLNKYGAYYVSYVLEDELGGYYDDYNFVINVVDSKEPVVLFKEYKSQAKLNTNIEPAKIEIQDDRDNIEDCSVVIYIERPNHIMYKWNPNDKDSEITYKYEGLYKIWYFVSDKSNNMSITYYTVLIVK